MIYITTKAYNAEGTLRRAVESMLGQSYGDFCYHLCDNGSTDGTGELVREYAARDTRVTPFFNPSNMAWTPESKHNVLNLARHLKDGDWLCVLDADDDYAPNFLEEMTRFTREYDLDYAACRSDFIDEATGEHRNEIVLCEDILVEGDGFGSRFPDYFRFMGARWGKLQKGSLFRRVDFRAMDQYLRGLSLTHRSDTAAMLWYLRYSRRAGVLAELLHHYRLYSVSHSTQNVENKLRDNEKMPEVYRDFLKVKAGGVSAANEAFIAAVYERSMRRTLGEAGDNGKPKSSLLWSR